MIFRTVLVPLPHLPEISGLGSFVRNSTEPARQSAATGQALSQVSSALVGYQVVPLLHVPEISGLGSFARNWTETARQSAATGQALSQVSSALGVGLGSLVRNDVCLAGDKP
jgi:hypothetical protein